MEVLPAHVALAVLGAAFLYLVYVPRHAPAAAHGGVRHGRRARGHRDGGGPCLAPQLVRAAMG